MAGLPWTHSTILRAEKYDSDQCRPLRAPLRLRGLLITSISPPWSPLNENKGELRRSSVEGLNYQVLDADSVPSSITLPEDEDCASSSLTSSTSTTEIHKICPSPTTPVTNHQKLPVHRAPKRLPFTRKPGRGRTHPGPPSASEVRINKGFHLPQQITVHAPPGPLDNECKLNSLMPLGSTTGPNELCSGLTVLITDDQKLPRHRSPSVRKVVQAQTNTEPFNNSETRRPTESFSPLAIQCMQRLHLYFWTHLPGIHDVYSLPHRRKCSSCL